MSSQLWPLHHSGIPISLGNLDRIRQVICSLVSSRAFDSLVARRLGEIELLLETLPLATDEFGIAARRLQTVRLYLEGGETGAARYELRILLGSLR